MSKITETRQLPPVQLAAEFAPATLRSEEREVDVVFYTGAMVRRHGFFSSWDLQIDVEGMDLSQLNDSAPLLDAHGTYSTDSVLGVVVPGSARIVNGQALARIRFAKAPEGSELLKRVEEVWSRVEQGVLRKVSMGVRFNEVEEIRAKDREDDGDLDLLIATRSTPYELSIVPVGADPGATVLADQSPRTTAVVVRTHGEEDEMPQQAAPEAQTQTPVDEAALRAQIRRETAERFDALRQAAEVIGLGAQVGEELAASEMSLDEARAELIRRKAEQQKKEQPRGAQSVELAEDQPRKRFDEALQGALLNRVNPQRYALEGDALDFRGISLREMARLHVERGGIDVRGKGPMTLAGLALGLGGRGISQAQLSGYHVTGDLASILASTANKVLLDQYREATPSYRMFCRRWDQKDFKQFSFPRLHGVPNPQTVDEKGEYPVVYLTDSGETGQLETKGLIIGFTRQTIVNDDLGALRTVPQMIVNAFVRNEQSEVISLFTGNPNLSDGDALFNTTDKTLVASGGAPSIEQAIVMERDLALQSYTLDDGTVQYLNFESRFVLVPSALKAKAMQYYETDWGAQVWEETKPRSHRGKMVISDSRLDAVSSAEWYEFADPMDAPVIAYGHLEGEAELYTEERRGFEVDGIQIKARRDWYAALVDRLGAIKNPGS